MRAIVALASIALFDEFFAAHARASPDAEPIPQPTPTPEPDMISNTSPLHVPGGLAYGEFHRSPATPSVEVTDADRARWAAERAAKRDMRALKRSRIAERQLVSCGRTL